MTYSIQQLKYMTKTPCKALGKKFWYTQGRRIRFQIREPVSPHPIIHRRLGACFASTTPSRRFVVTKTVPSQQRESLL